MSKKFMLSGFLMAVLSVFVIGGCATSAPDKDANLMIKEGLAKLIGVTSYDYELDVNGDIKDETSGDVKFNAKMSGSIDVKDTKDPKLALKLVGSMDGGPDAAGSLDAEIMLDKAAFYAKATKLEIEGMEDMPAEMKEMFGKWWKVTLPEGTLDEFTTTLPQGNEEEMTPEQKEIKQAFEEASIFTNPKYEGSENVMGDNSYKYSVDLDRAGVVAFVQKVGEIQGEELSSGDIDEMKDALEKIDVKGYIWISVSSGIVNKFSGTVNVDEGLEGSSGTMGLTVAIGNINKPVVLNIPADAEEFPTELILGAMMGGMVADPSLTDPSLTDSSFGDLEGVEDFDAELMDLEGVEDFDPAAFE